MAAAGESAGNNRDNRFHAEIIESLGRFEAKFEVLLKVLIELQVNTSQIVRNTSITATSNYKSDEEKHKAPNPSSSTNSLHQPDLSILLTPEELNITTAAAGTDNLDVIKERTAAVNGNQEIADVIPNDRIEKSAEDGGQVTSKDVLDGRNDYWKVASNCVEKNSKAITKVKSSDTQTMYVEKIMKLTPQETLEYRTGIRGYTALHCAAAYGYAKAAEVIVNKNHKTTQMVDGFRRVPLVLALESVKVGQRETVDYLYSVTRHEHPSPFSGEQGESLLRRTIDAGFYDIASSLVQRFPELVIDQTNKVQTSAMYYMAERPFAFASGAKLTFWKHCIYSMIKVDINTAFELDTQTNENKSFPQSLEDTNGDEESPVDRDEKNPTEHPKNTEGEKAKLFKSETVGDNIFVVMCTICNLIHVMFKFFVVFPVFFVRFIISWTPVPRIKQLYKELYDDKVKHKQAEALVKSIFKNTMNKREVVDFFEGSNIMKMAIRHGSVEFVEVCIQLFPYLVWYKMGEEHMLQMAIAERNETILNLICKTTEKDKIDLVSRCDDKENTLLHYAAKLAPSAQLNSVSGAYLQMQREIQWFKGVENMISEKDRYKRNNNGDTARNIFTEEHKKLKESGEKWLKDTSGSCMVVAALIATVAFASAFTVPGGNISDSNSSKNGIPVFLKENSFMVFAVADAMALFSSITSVLMFLAIYTSRYAEIDFLKSLPNKLIIGLVTLFISMASVLIAFGASLFIVLGERFTWALIPIVVFSCVPVTLFGWLQLPLFFEMIRTTYWGSLFREHTHISSLQLNTKEEN
ncbi:hypothetical protein MKW92_046981 [Papaver armeniacum]|nr:hypothetical protein MKW92_046981 [Papaver armeniacum]